VIDWSEIVGIGAFAVVALGLCAVFVYARLRRHGR
jgi:hypothetical protein